MTRTVGVVIPAYRPDVALLGKYVRALTDRLSPDVVRIELDAATADVVEALADLPAEVNAVRYRRGKGTAITAGFEALDTDVLAFADADGSTPADSIADVLAPVLDGEADLSVGSRRHPDATVASHQTFARRYLGDGFAWLARQLLDAKLYDYQCGAKATTRETWRAVRHHLYEPGFAWDIELVAVAAALGARITEVPVVWEDQPGSTVSPVRTTLRLGRGLLIARHRAKLLADDDLHTLLESRRNGPQSLVDRLAAEAFDE
ncbi:Glycosyl transferase family 2 [Halogranum amylolyticum]|uniref:Glycosyl transferase family 2 n=1 Tax=Halogranum amylolyticum TaxID=660520 RepID=A0A1H8PH67_9EURY|nr:glycosyltransferase [Halogranum amylolyticum]SEO41255.1 Glycosyl transferase family 2 [Halogranum amylolyticum]